MDFANIPKKISLNILYPVRLFLFLTEENKAMSSYFVFVLWSGILLAEKTIIEEWDMCN